MKVLILGSLTIDYIDGEERPGGPALYCSMACAALGVDYFCYGVKPREYRWGVPQGKFLEGEGPVFEHKYFGERRISRLTRLPPIVGDSIDIKNFDVAIVSPVFGEFSISLVEHIVANIPSAIDLQGFVRDTDQNRNIIYKTIDESVYNILEKAKLLHISEDEYSVMKRIPEKTISIVTYGSRGCHIYSREKKIYIPAYKVKGDPTGAGDFFTTILTVHYIKTRDILRSTVYAAVATSIFIEGKLGKEPHKMKKLSEFGQEIAKRIRKTMKGVRLEKGGKICQTLL